MPDACPNSTRKSRRRNGVSQIRSYIRYAAELSLRRTAEGGCLHGIVPVSDVCEEREPRLHASTALKFLTFSRTTTIPLA